MAATASPFSTECGTSPVCKTRGLKCGTQYHRPLLQRDFPEKRLSEFRSLRKSKKSAARRRSTVSWSALSRSGRGEATVSDRPLTAPRMLPAIRRMTRLRLDASPPSPKHSHEIATIGRKHETEGHGGQVPTIQPITSPVRRSNPTE